MIFHEKSCDRLCLLDFNEWNCIIFLYGAIDLIIIIIIIVEFSWTVGSASTIEKTETSCSLNALLQF